MQKLIISKSRCLSIRFKRLCQLQYLGIHIPRCFLYLDGVKGTRTLTSCVQKQVLYQLKHNLRRTLVLDNPTFTGLLLHDFQNSHVKRSTRGCFSSFFTLRAITSSKGSWSATCSWCIPHQITKFNNHARRLSSLVVCFEGHFLSQFQGTLHLRR